jgi:hypothetical protein
LRLVHAAEFSPSGTTKNIALAVSWDTQLSSASTRLRRVEWNAPARWSVKTFGRRARERCSQGTSEASVLLKKDDIAAQ